MSRFCVNGELLTHRFEDAKTLYEAFQLGKSFSSKVMHNYHVAEITVPM